jgi:hypothetical protein
VFSLAFLFFWEWDKRVGLYNEGSLLRLLLHELYPTLIKSRFDFKFFKMGECGKVV